ncbi:hypothetical protein Klosneuvirus_1_248 [Klosneuvirus KNV1]|uniref:Uncharacterized protein n=1 Tax=Klosneuvirus KNV1 TaxID=1977640 RepID=A0A1V0SI97_9VIRU|nr:hypothetical protein Klosneuvirus_1_248 [Klosneuvirus KNV1]
MSINDILVECGKIIERKKKLEVPIPTFTFNPDAAEFRPTFSMPEQEPESEPEFDPVCIDNNNIEYDKFDDCLKEFDKIKNFHFQDETVDDIVDQFIQSNKTDTLTIHNLRRYKGDQETKIEFWKNMKTDDAKVNVKLLEDSIIEIEYAIKFVEKYITI